jgi:hypothetical protein
MEHKRVLLASDIMSMAEYAAVRAEKRRQMVEIKRKRRVAVGPFVTFFFENYDTMWYQVHEMLFVEKGGEEQIPDELAAYNPLIPKGNELVATFMIEIDDPERRKRQLMQLGGIENTAFLKFGGETIVADPEQDVDRTTAEGKASSVQFVHFRMNSAQIQKFCTPGTEIVLGLQHPNYRHMTVLPEDVRSELAKDFAPS